MWGRCISVTYVCKKEFPEGVSVSIDGTRQAIKKSAGTVKEDPKPEKPEKPKERKLEGELTDRIKKEFGEEVIVSVFGSAKNFQIYTEIGDNNVTVTFTNDKKTGEIDVIFMVNGEVDADPKISRRDKITIARKVNDIFERSVKNMNDGTRLKSSAYEGDGKGEARKKAYLKKGFREEKPGSKKLIAEVKNGEINRGERDYKEDELTQNEKLTYIILTGEDPDKEAKG